MSHINYISKLLAIALLLAGRVAVGASSGDAIDRASVMVRSPDRAVMLGATPAGGRIIAVGERGFIALSDDDGRSWVQAATPTSVTLTAVRFVDATHGWAVGHGGTVLASVDGGKSWRRQLDGRRIAQIALDAARMSGDVSAVRDAERLVSDGPDKPLLDLLVIDQMRLLAVGAYGIAVGSEDGGRTWTSWMARLPNPKGLHIYASQMRGSTLLLAGEQGLVMQSEDAGHTFRRIDTPYSGSFFSAELPADQSIVLAGLRGTALRSTDGGTSWSSLSTPMPASIIGTALSADRRLLAANQAGFVMALQGDQFQPINATPLPPVNGMLVRPSGAVLVLTIQGVKIISTASSTAK